MRSFALSHPRSLYPSLPRLAPSLPRSLALLLHPSAPLVCALRPPHSFPRSFRFAVGAEIQDGFTNYRGWQLVSLTFFVLRGLKSMHFQPRLGLVTQTIMMALTNLIHFVILFVMVLTIYSIMGHLTFVRERGGKTKETRERDRQRQRDRAR